MRFKLLAVLLTLIAPAARAQQPALDAWWARATANWSIDEHEATEWILVKFRNEDGEPRELMGRVDEIYRPVCDRDMRSVLPSPLYKFENLLRESGRPTTGRVTESKVSVYALRKKRCSIGVIDLTLPDQFVIVRQDNPNVEIPAAFEPIRGMASARNPEAWPVKNNLERVVVLKPTAWAGGAESILTTSPDLGLCGRITGRYAEGQARDTTILRELTPREWEILLAGGGAEGSFDAVTRSPAWHRADSEAQRGRNSDANAQFVAVRTAVRDAAADQIIAARGSQTPEAFSHFESRFWLCRMQHAGGDDMRQSFVRKTRTDRSGAVAYWRAAIIEELRAYLREDSRLAPSFESPEDRDAARRAADLRIVGAADALIQGQSRPVAAETPAPQPAQERRPRQQLRDASTRVQSIQIGL